MRIDTSQEGDQEQDRRIVSAGASEPVDDDGLSVAVDIHRDNYAYSANGAFISRSTVETGL
ncbi:hypothetical protein MES5069_700014 [Mesorhizobium escarrei]|uniref:Uncharacterized protein n=1 Tax=Mesorhizobium escarrei TaxID=666018 RepID=A0ABN8KEW3_9HYPH|nr:hypothetical protein MES5069_700014 [Mesorhizobium escarrei]